MTFQELHIVVSPHASKNEITASPDGLRVKLTAAPDKGKANKALIAALAKYYSVSKSQVEIRRGLTSKTKLVRIHKL